MSLLQLEVNYNYYLLSVGGLAFLTLLEVTIDMYFLQAKSVVSSFELEVNHSYCLLSVGGLAFLALLEVAIVMCFLQVE